MSKEVTTKIVRVYADKHGKEPFWKWFGNLRDMTAQVRIQRRIRNLELGNLGDYRSVGEGVFELRLHFGPGFRIYFGEETESILLLLCGGDKKTQSKDIKMAKAYWYEYQESQQ